MLASERMWNAPWTTDHHGNHFGDPDTASCGAEHAEKGFWRRSVRPDVSAAAYSLNVVGTIWVISGALILAFWPSLNAMGIDYNYTQGSMRRITSPRGM
jgi:hypothetical protein